MRAIRIQNPVLDLYVADIAVAYNPATSLLNVTLRSNNSFAANDLGVFGNPGEELTEPKKIASLSGTTIVVLDSILNFPHIKDTPVYKTLWDFVVIEGASTAGQQFNTLTQSPIQWDSPKNKTIYLHQAGTDSWQYRFRFYNSVTQTYSEYSPTLTGGGFTKNQAGYIIQESREEANDMGGRVLDTRELLRALTRAKNVARASNSRYWFWKVNGYQSNISQPALAGVSVYNIDAFVMANGNRISDFGTIDTIEFMYNSGATHQRWTLRRKADVEFLEYTKNLNRPSIDYPHFYRLLPADSNSVNGYIEIDNPILNSGVGTFYLNYYMNEADYNSVDDVTRMVMPEIYVDYLCYKIYAARGNDTRAKAYYEQFTGPENRERTMALKDLTGLALLDLLDEQSKKAQGQPMSIWRYRGQKAMSRLYGSRRLNNSPDYIRENYFNGPE